MNILYNIIFIFLYMIYPNIYTNFLLLNNFIFLNGKLLTLNHINVTYKLCQKH